MAKQLEIGGGAARCNGCGAILTDRDTVHRVVMQTCKMHTGSVVLPPLHTQPLALLCSGCTARMVAFPWGSLCKR